jgi:hypothetical protein
MIFTMSRSVSLGHVSMASEEKRYEGLWWRAEQPDKKVPGSLLIKPRGMWLSLNGSLRESEDVARDFSPDPADYDLVLGAQPNGNQVVLENCVETARKSSLFGRGYSTQDYLVKRVYFGLHVDDLEDLNFSEYIVRYTFLEDWLRDVSLGVPEEVAGGYMVPYDPSCASTVPYLEFDLGDLSLEVVSKPWPFVETEEKRAGVAIAQYCRVRSQRPRPVDAIEKAVLGPFRNFLNLATTRPNSITELSATITVEGERSPGQVRIFSQGDYAPISRSSLMNRGVVLFYAKQVSDDPTRYLRTWIDFEREMKDVCELFFAIHYDQGAYASNRLLNIAQTLEALSRARYGRDASPKQDFQKRVDAVTASAPEDLRQWLKEKLSFANFKPFGDLLGELIEQAKPLAGQLVSKPNVFVRWVKDTRNFLTHVDRAKKKCIAEGSDLELMISCLLWLARIHLLREAGFSRERCGEIIGENDGFKKLCTHLATHAPWRYGDDEEDAVDRALGLTP